MDRGQMTAGGPHLMRLNSFIPTSSSAAAAGHNAGNNGKMGQIQIQQLALQSQLQAQSQGHLRQILPTMNNNNHPHQYQQHSAPPHQNNQHQQQHHPVSHQNNQQQFNGYYQNSAENGGPPPNQFLSHGTMPGHLPGPEKSQPPPPPNTRTLRKTFSSHYGTLTHPQQSHQLSVVNGNPLYGNLMGSGGGRHVGTTNGRPHDPPPQQPIQIQPVINQIQQQHHSHKILQHYPSGAGVEGDGLPSTLVESMRTLFDILDDSKSGRVRLSDIESRWENNDPAGLPKGNTGAEPLIKMGVMGYLRKVTPPDGMLTFDRFCSGLRLALVTNNQSSSSGNNNTTITYGNNNNPPQHHQRFKNMSGGGGGNLYANNNPSAINGTANGVPHPPSGQMISQRPTSLPISTNHNVNQNGGHPHQQRTTTTTMSRIPGFSSSKLTTSAGNNGSGIPVSPKNKFSSNLLPYSHHSNSNPAMGTARRIPLTQSQQQQQQGTEQGTTVAMIHQPPKHQSGGGNNAIPAFSHRPHDIQIGTIRLTTPALVTPPHGGFTKTHRYSSKNGSLDNLKSDTEESGGKLSNSDKIRPPSAPILDTTDDDDGGGGGGGDYYVANNRSSAKRERARSRDRDVDESKRSGTAGSRSGKGSTELSFGKRVVSFVTPRQRTLSMPQLQLSKLKSANKSINQCDNHEDSSPSASSSSHSPLSSGETTTKIGALKSSLKSSAHGSSIPTKMVKQKSDVTVTSGGGGGVMRNGLSFKDSNQESSNSEKEMVPPPPKPPRNNNGLSVIVGHVLGSSSATPDPPLSGSSTASIPSKPEIRQYLQSWKKGVAEKRNSPPAEESDNVPPPLPAQPPPNADAESQNGNNETVKLRGDKKLNLRRRETARRHTVQAGIDFATLKRLKQLEQERDVLQQGMSALEGGKEWYTKQMEGVDDKISILTKGGPIADQWNDSLEERLNVLTNRISEINGLLGVLMDGSSSRIPHHMNLQIPSHLSVRTITRLKEQNRQLTQEVSDCSHRVTQLETEKAMLLRQLFHQKSNHLSEETVYM